jgi:hypothetical protein
LVGLEHMVAAMAASQHSTAISSAKVNSDLLPTGTQPFDSVDDEDLLD